MITMGSTEQFQQQKQENDNNNFQTVLGSEFQAAGREAVILCIVA